MCGIAALFGKQSSQDIEKMIQMVEHRGPDAAGVKNYFKEEQCIAALGHRRLSILDLSSQGDQPFHAYGLAMTYNGEVYNYIELREELRKLGETFISETDTEVILKAYYHWGVKAFSRFNGMFSLVIYHEKSGEWIAVRDRFGVKPLYYWQQDGQIAFASEIKQFFPLKGWQKKVNHQRAYDFLNWGVIDHTHETLFEGVHQLRGGEYMQNGVIKKWYHLPDNKFEGSFQEASEQFRFLLENSVKLRLRSDVSVGSCLSGGLDSSSIVCLMSRFTKVHTFSARSHVERFDEGHFIDEVVRKTSAVSYTTTPELSELKKQLSTMLWHQDEPVASSSAFAQWKVFECAQKQKVKVLLDGQGADEQLSGYHTLFSNRLLALLKKGRCIQFVKEIERMKSMHGSQEILRKLLALLVPLEWQGWIREKWGKSSLKPSWLGSKLDYEPRVFGFGRAGLEEVAREQMLFSSLPMLLHLEDRNSMAHSVESRTPFLDYRLVELNMSLPSDFKMCNGMTKRVLRQAMQGILPEKIEKRVDKLGFSTAEEVWILKEEPEQFRRLLEESIEITNGLISERALQLFDQMQRGSMAYSSLIFRLIAFGQWMNLSTTSNVDYKTDERYCKK